MSLFSDSRYLLGISAFYHDSAACLLRDGEIMAAAQEERFTRKKHDAQFPCHAIRYCLETGGISADKLEAVVFYDKPLLTFERILETYLRFAPQGVRSFSMAMPLWLKEKLFLKSTLRKQFKSQFHVNLPTSRFLFGEHHESHAASAFFPSPFERAAVLCMDGVGEWATTSAWEGRGNRLDRLWEIHFPHSLGLLYSAFTFYTGFKVNSGEYKVMGLAPYGRPLYVDRIYDHLIDVKPDGSFRLNMDYFNYCQGLTMTNDKFHELFGGAPRSPESKITQREMDIARSIQEVIEDVVFRLAKKTYSETGLTNLCLAGGVALNCVANGKILRAGPFSRIWIQPAAGDAGGALGCALAAWHIYLDQARNSNPKDSMKGSFLGPEFTEEEIASFLHHNKIEAKALSQEELFRTAAQKLKDGKVVGWFQGRMEFGPRALGNRSILGDPSSPQMQTQMNLKIKYRESFRPFAPAVLREKITDYFEMDRESPYMLLVAPVKADKRLNPPTSKDESWGIELLKVPKSKIPAVTHVDYSARIQTVEESTNPSFYKLLKAFETLTDCPVLVNTSFNVRGEPIVCTPEDAYRCFQRTEMDSLVLGNYIVEKPPGPAKTQDRSWMKEFELD